MTITIITSVLLEFWIETLVMLVSPRFVLLEFSVFTYTKLENSDLKNSDFSKLPKTVSRDINYGRNLLLEV